MNTAKHMAETRAKRAREAILGELKWFKVNLDRAIAAAEKGERVDEHLIHNIVQVTAEIGRHNLLLDLLPALEDA